MKSRRTRRDAFTLVEMMVSLAVSTIIVVQVFLVLTTQQNVQASNARMVEAMQDARLVAEMIQADIRMAGYMVPAFAGISNRDGGSSGTDALCISNASAIADSEVSTASGVFERAQLTATLTGGSTSVQLDTSTMDIDGVGGDDFIIGQGIIVADTNDTHCATISGNNGGGTITFTPATPAGFDAAIPNARAVPALIYEVTATGLIRNGLLLSPMVENLQVEFGLDSNLDGSIGAFEWPLDDLSGLDVSLLRQVRISVIAKSNSPDPDRMGSGMPESGNHSGSAPDGYIRRRFTTIVVPRNITGIR